MKKEITKEQMLKQLEAITNTLEKFSEVSWYADIIDGDPISCALDSLYDAMNDIDSSLEEED